MTKFIDRFKQYGDYSLRGMRKTAIALVPKDRSVQDVLHEELNRGRDVLEDEDLLNMYLYSYGKMHKFKLVKAFVCLFEHVDFNNEEIEIYDWGCGQGLATMCLLDCLNYFEIRPNVKGIFLIDQSHAATNRASEVIRCHNTQCQINTIVKDIDSLKNSDFISSDTKKIHLFSNILDVESYDLSRFAKFFHRNFNGSNYMVCVGPCYNVERLDKFLGYIEPDINYCRLVCDRGEWLNDWSIALQISYKHVAKQNTFSSIIINHELIGNYSITLSNIRKAVNSEGNPFSYYWLTINGMICCTGKKLTELLGDYADAETAKRILKANEGRFEIAQAVDDDGKPIFVDDDPGRPFLKIQVVPSPWIDNYGSKYSKDWKRLLEGPNPKIVETMIINNQNFQKDDLWVSKPITSKITGEIIYWCTLDSFENGVLLYLSKCVWESLSIVNKDTVWDVLSSGKYIIREARDRKTNEWLMTDNKRPIMMISESHQYIHGDWDNSCMYSGYKELNETKEYSIKTGTVYIHDNAFSCCKSLQVVTIPESVERVGHDIFKGCNSLIKILIPRGTYHRFAVLLPKYEDLLVEEKVSYDDLPF